MEIPLDQTLPLIMLVCSAVFLLCSLVIFFFFRYGQQVRRQQQKLLMAELEFNRRLLQVNIRSQEEERVRISKELHDHVGSSLSTLRFLVRDLGQKKDPGETQQLADTYCNMMDEVITQVRHLSHSLAPPGLEIWGLQEALEQLCEKLNGTDALQITLTGNHAYLRALPFEHALALYRVVQELLANTLKHAAARSVQLRLEGPANLLLLSYADDGVGCNQPEHLGNGIGLQNLKSRVQMTGGRYRIDTAPGKGFKATFEIPITTTQHATDRN